MQDDSFVPGTAGTRSSTMHAFECTHILSIIIVRSIDKYVLDLKVPVSQILKLISVGIFNTMFDLKSVFVTRFSQNTLTIISAR